MQNAATNSGISDDLMGKLKKILALAGEQNPNAHQRDAAMQKALELLQKHNLTLEQVQGFETGPKAVSHTDYDFGKLDPWVRALINGTTKLYYCDWYKTKFTMGGDWRPVFIGTPENIAVCKDITKWLMESIRNEAKRVYKGDRFAQRSFCIGAAQMIQERVREMRKVEKEAAERARNNKEPGSSLMVLDDMRNKLQQLNQEAMKGLKLTRSAARKSTYDATAGERGRQYAGGLNLGRQITGTSTKRIGG